MRRKFLPFSLPYLDNKEKSYLLKVIDSGWITTGPVTNKFEERFSDYIGAKFAIAVSSCTAGLHLSLAALGIREKDEVITTPFTFASTGNVIMHLGAKPIFLDISKDTYNIAPDRVSDLLRYRKRRSKKLPKAIIAVHYAGLPCDMNKITAITKEYGIPIIEDAAHALGSEYCGKKIGNISESTCFSFYPTKLITTGEGGMVTTNNERLAKNIRIFSSHGITKSSWDRYSKKCRWKYKIIYPGFKYNMTDLQSALGLCQLDKIAGFIRKRREYSCIYDNAFRNIPEIEIPPDNKNAFHSRHIYPILINNKLLRINRDSFIEELKNKNIGTSVHFIPLHLHPVYRKLGYRKHDFPVCEGIYQRVLSLPLFPAMTIKDVNDVISVVSDIVRKYRR